MVERAQPRGECPIVKLTRESHDGRALSTANSGGVATTGGASESPPRSGEEGEAKDGVEEGFKPLNFAIIVMCDEGMWPQE